jgi:hypothetical protein
MFELGLYGASESSIFEKAGVKVISNTPEEIRDLTIEVEERLNELWIPQTEDQVLQKKFWDIIRHHSLPNYSGNFDLHIGTMFLRNNSYLLD